MSSKTGIQWTDATWNPVVGCDKVSQGCKFCYAKLVHDRRYKAFLEGKPVAPQYRFPFETIQLKPERLTWPLSLQKPSRIFVNSVSDLFHDDVPDDFLDQVFVVMGLASRHTFQVLTKRPARMRQYVNSRARWDALDWARAGNTLGLSKRKLRGLDLHLMWPFPNVQLGTSTENQVAFDERWPHLGNTIAAVRFVSMEPLLGPVVLGETALGPSCGTIDPLDWVIVGGESGDLKQDVRPMEPAWATAIRDECAKWDTSFFFKQWGEWLFFVGSNGLLPDGRARVDGKTYPASRVRVFDHFYRVRVGTKPAGRLLEGRTHDEFPKPPRLVHAK